MDTSIVVPVYNQLHYTKICLASLCHTINKECEVIVIDNGSSDGTAEYLSGCQDVRVITNRENLGCAAAWNQGVKASQAPWIAILNNDTVLSPHWLAGLLDFAAEKGVDIVSPAFREGEYNYDISEYATDYVSRMQSVSRMGVAQGICFMVRRIVFDKVGHFDENFRIGQFEDRDFFRRARLAGFVLGTTGRSFIHHFGSITQDSIRGQNTAWPYERENRAYYRRKYGLTLWKRFLERRRVKLQDFLWRTSEKVLYGHTLTEKWINGRLRYF
ncbi:MAG TPA: glycosyltransferase family 2 protein [Thermodesulfovibrionales bacterium]|nr:glycosyltransferase family 2 protein [Thermodesulfovibrionales bacterium]